MIWLIKHNIFLIYAALVTSAENIVTEIVYCILSISSEQLLINPSMITEKVFILSFFLCHRQRLPAKNVYYYRCPDHRRNYVMSFAFCFDREDDVYQFAYCYPYTYSRLQHYLASLERRNLDYLQREQLGLSVVSHCMFALGVDRYVFFRADTDYYRSSRPITDILNRYTCLV